MDIYKFGGTSQGSIKALDYCYQLLNQDNHPKVAVVSAPSGITNLLIQGFSQQQSTGNFSPETFSKIISRFQEVYPGNNELITSSQTELERRINQNLSPDNQYASIAAFGEWLEQQLFADYLTSRGLNSRVVDPASCFQLTGNPRNADYDQKSDELVQKQINGFSGITVMGGFYGVDSNHQILVFSRGGSDYTQTLIARAVQAETGFNCTDVDGIKPLDPRILPNQELPTIPELRYRQAQELSQQGAKVLHPRCIEPLIERNIPLYVINTFNPSGPRTRINGQEGGHPEVVAITGKRQNYVVLNISTGGMAGRSGYLDTFFHRLQHIDIDTISTSEVGISVSFSHQGQDLEKIKKELVDLGQVTISSGSSLVAVVGNKLGEEPRIIQDIFRVLSSEGVSLTQASMSNQYSFWITVPHNQFETVSRALYHQLIEQKK